MSLHSAIVSLTHNIPWFLRDPAVSIIGEKCYTTLIYDFDILNGPCLKHAISKGLGIGIVLGGSIVKLPQIAKIVQTKSSVGLSLAAYALETLAYAISLAYSARSHFPFSTYGENFFLLIQNIVITLQIITFSGVSETFKEKRGTLLGVAALMAVTGFVLSNEALMPQPLLTILQALTVPLALLSKAPQIISNYRLRSTGNLSPFLVLNALLGCLARVFTTFQEIDDPLVLWGFGLAALLNLVIAIQMAVYWNNRVGVARKSTGSSGSLRRSFSEERKVGGYGGDSPSTPKFNKEKVW